MKNLLFLLLVLAEGCLQSQTFNNLYNINFPYTYYAGEMLKYKDKLYIANADDQLYTIFMTLDSSGNYAATYLPVDTTKVIFTARSGMLVYKNQIVIAAECVKTDSAYGALIIMDTNFVYQRSILLPTGNYENLDHIVVADDYLVVKLHKSTPGLYDNRFIKLDSNFNIVWNRYYTGTQIYGNNFTMTTDRNGNIIYNQHKDTNGSIDGFLVKLDINTGDVILKRAMNNTEYDDFQNILFTTEDHRIVAENCGKSLNIYDEDFNLISYKGGIYDRQCLSYGFEINDGFIFTGVLYNYALTDRLDTRAYICKTDKNGNKLWERYITHDTAINPLLYEAFYKGCVGFNGGYVFCGASFSPDWSQSAWVVSVDSNGCWGAGDSCDNIHYFTDTFSDVGINNYDQSQLQVLLYPNPSSNADVLLKIDAQESSDAMIKVYSVNGDHVLKLSKNLIEGENTILLPTAKLSKGVYIVNVSSQTLSKNIQLVIQ